MNLATSHSAARQHDREDRAPVAPAAVAVEPGGTAEFGHADHQGLLEHSPPVQVFDAVPRRPDRWVEPAPP